MKILDVKVNDVSLEQALSKVENLLDGKDGNTFTIVTPNPEIVIQARGDQRLREVLNTADLAVPDGVGLRLAGIKHTVHGVELMRELCRIAADRGWGIGLYGGRIGAAKEALVKLQKECRNLEGWAYSPPELKLETVKNQQHVLSKFNKTVESELRYVVNKIIDENTRILFVGLGAPKQEYFMDMIRRALEVVKNNSAKLEADIDGENSSWFRTSPVCRRGRDFGFGDLNLVIMTVGGSFDELAGRVRAAPLWVKRLGLKWLWRLLQEPRRLKRQLRLIEFAGLSIQENFKIKKDEKIRL